MYMKFYRVLVLALVLFSMPVVVVWAQDTRNFLGQGTHFLTTIIQLLFGGAVSQTGPVVSVHNTGEYRNNEDAELGPEDTTLTIRLQEIQDKLYGFGVVLNSEGNMVPTRLLTTKEAREAHRLIQEAQGLSLRLQLINAEDALTHAQRVVEDAESNRRVANKARMGKSGREGVVAQRRKEEAIGAMIRARNNEQQAESQLRKVERAIRKRKQAELAAAEREKQLKLPLILPIPRMTTISGFCIEDPRLSDSMDGVFTCADEVRKRELAFTAGLTDAENKELEGLRTEFYDRLRERQEEIDLLAIQNKAREMREFCDRYSLTC